MSQQKQPSTKLTNIQQVITFHQQQLHSVSKQLSRQSQTVVSLKNSISTLQSKLQSKYQQTQSIFRVDISKFNDQISRKCTFQKAIAQSINKTLDKLTKDNTKTKQNVNRMQIKLKELEEAIGI